MVDILMAVYNGEKFVAEQIDSILAQSETDWHLIICDDMSKDRSFEIISGYAQNIPTKYPHTKMLCPQARLRQILCPCSNMLSRNMSCSPTRTISGRKTR